MEEITFLVKGLIIGFSVAAPVGPVEILCISRTLTYGRLSGLISGMGAATSDAIYGLIAAFGLSLISDFLIAQQSYLKLIGGLFLIYLGVKSFMKKSLRDKKGNVRHRSLITDYISTFFLNLTSPATILSFLAIFAGLGLNNISGDFNQNSALVLGVFLGSALWWLILSGGVGLVHRKIGVRSSIWINRASGLIIGGLGIFFLITLLA